MTIDTSLISVRDRGKFAISWIAGTNPKVLRSRFQSSHIYTVDVPEVCDEIMEIIKSKEDKIPFRILFKLYFGTIRIFGMQVEQLYNVAQNFLCFHTFVIKQYSRKRKSSENTNSQSKRRRVNSFDFTSLLLESEEFNKYSEKEFSFPNEMGSSSRRQTTSTSIEIKHITIKQVNWDNPLPEQEEDMFGEATEHEKLMLLSALNGTMEDEFNLQSLIRRKRKSSLQIPDSPPVENKEILDESVDEFRGTPSIYNDSQSVLSVFKNHPPIERNVLDDTQRNIVQDNSVSECSLIEDPISVPVTSANVHTPNERCSLNNVPESLPLDEHQSYPTPCEMVIQNKRVMKRKSSRYRPIIDLTKKLPIRDAKTLLENVWFNCHNREKKEHTARVVSSRIRTDSFNISIPNRRFRSAKLVVHSKKDLKCKLNQNVALNRELILRAIFGSEYDLYKDEIMYQSQKRAKIRRLDMDEIGQNIGGLEMLPREENNNISLEQDLNNNITQLNTHENNQHYLEDMPLRCSINEIDLNKISFDFPNEADKQRSEWCKESVLMKLLLAWKSGEPIVNMKSIIYGANRINAALTFRTLLDLAGQHYIELEKTETNAIKSIRMGTAVIRRLNETFS